MVGHVRRAPAGPARGEPHRGRRATASRAARRRGTGHRRWHEGQEGTTAGSFVAVRQGASPPLDVAQTPRPTRVPPPTPPPAALVATPMRAPRGQGSPPRADRRSAMKVIRAVLPMLPLCERVLPIRLTGLSIALLKATAV